MQILKFNAFKDNYIWGLQHKNQFLVIDPGDPAPVINFLSSNKHLNFSGILITHHHSDHVGGIQDLAKIYDKNKSKNTFINSKQLDVDIPILGPRNCQKFGVNVFVEEGDKINIGAFKLSILDIPGHTQQHLGYFFENNIIKLSPFFFCGDTLFAAGCGRILGGDAKNLFKSLKKIGNLPKSTLIFCAHEYTLNNIQFASSLYPDDSKITLRKIIVENKRIEGNCTIPSTLEEELETNPFYRCKNLNEFIQMRKKKDVWN
jgi:hydroxyacylglutathione hydrolase